MRMSEVIPPLVMLALSAVLVFGTWHLGYWANTTAGPAFAPIWVAAAGTLLALLQLRAVRTAASPEIYDWPDAAGRKRIAITFLGLVAFSVLSPLLGMVPSAALFVFLFLYGLLARPLSSSVITAAATTFLIYGIFVWWLNVGLPTGYLGI